MITLKPVFFIILITNTAIFYRTFEEYTQYNTDGNSRDYIKRESLEKQQHFFAYHISRQKALKIDVINVLLYI